MGDCYSQLAISVFLQLLHVLEGLSCHVQLNKEQIDEP